MRMPKIAEQKEQNPLMVEALKNFSYVIPQWTRKGPAKTNIAEMECYLVNYRGQYRMVMFYIMDDGSVVYFLESHHKVDRIADVFEATGNYEIMLHEKTGKSDTSAKAETAEN